jgi:hypothetical protein
MAVSQYSGIGITEMRNKLGGEVHTRNKSGQIVRQYVIPTNTITAYRTSIRDTFRDVNALWSAVTPEEVEQWHIFGQRIMRRNSIAQSYRLGARTVFIACNQNLILSGIFPISAPVFNATAGIILKAQISLLNVSQFQITVKFIPNSYIVPLGSVLCVSASAPVSPGINYPRNNFLQIAIYPELTPCDPLDIFNDYDHIFSAPVFGQKIFVRLSCVNFNSGLRSVPVTFALVVS